MQLDAPARRGVPVGQITEGSTRFASHALGKAIRHAPPFQVNADELIRNNRARLVPCRRPSVTTSARRRWQAGCRFHGTILQLETAAKTQGNYGFTAGLLADGPPWSSGGSVRRRRDPAGDSRSRVEAELVHDAANVTLDGAVRNEKARSDLLVAQTLAHQPCDSCLTFAKRIGPRVGRSLRISPRRFSHC